MTNEKRPRTRGECKGGVRPCPWLSCRYHTAIMTGGDTCALDVADRGPQSLVAIAATEGLTRQRVHQIVQEAVHKLRVGYNCSGGDIVPRARVARKKKRRRYKKLQNPQKSPKI